VASVRLLVCVFLVVCPGHTWAFDTSLQVVNDGTPTAIDSSLKLALFPGNNDNKNAQVPSTEKAPPTASDVAKEKPVITSTPTAKKEVSMFDTLKSVFNKMLSKDSPDTEPTVDTPTKISKFKSAAVSTNPAKYAYVSILTKDNPGYVVGALMVARSLLETNSLLIHDKEQADVVMLLVNEVNYSDKSIEALAAGGYKILGVDGVASPFPKKQCDRYCDFYVKLRLWQLVQYERVVYIDSDVLVRNNINKLQLMSLGPQPSMAAVPDNVVDVKRRINAGVLVLDPSEEIFQTMLQKIGKIETKFIVRGDSWEYTEQTFLHAFFRDCFFDETCEDRKLIQLSTTFNAWPGMAYSAAAGDRVSYLPDAYILHFWGGNKPWIPGVVERVNVAARPYYEEYEKDRLNWGITTP